MRIIKFPQFNICTCSECGTVFQPEAGDTIEYRFLSLSEHIAYIRCPTCEFLCELSKPAATDINVGDKSGWISVEDRLPNEFVSVLGYMTDAGDFPPVRECYLVGGVFYFPALNDRHPVTHWMPLPEPPKLKGE